MKTVSWILLVALCATVANGCGKKSDGTSSAGGAATTATASKFDGGPRAGESSVDEALVKTGEGLFQTKGCSACHGFGRRISCPDLQGVTMRRTHQWMENQILHPEVMTKEDPIARQLFAQYSLQMPNQQLTQPEAQAVIEFLKHKDHELQEASESKEEGRDH